MKKEDFRYCVGIDVSKLTLDLAFLDCSDQIEPASLVVSNDRQGMTQITKWIRTLQVKYRDILFCMEFTGVYNLPLQKFLHSKDAFIWMEMPVKIIRSSGLQRGKNDKVDAQRIAAYAARYQSDKVRWTPPSVEQQSILDLVALRNRLIELRNGLSHPIKELASMNEKSRSQQLDSHCRQPIQAIKKSIEQVEQKIRTWVYRVPAMGRNIELMMTIPGIGFWTALAMACSTDNFKRPFTAKQLACYCGCAPFERRSGTSIRGKAKVSHMANKHLKSLLTLGASSIIKSKNELAVYYQRKVAEGKNKMSVINALRNKLIHRIVAVIERQTPYMEQLHSQCC